MEKRIKNCMLFVNSLGNRTKFIAKISLITVFCAIILSIITYTYGNFTFFLLSDDLIAVARSTAGVGFLGTIIIHLFENNKENGTG